MIKKKFIKLIPCVLLVLLLCACKQTKEDKKVISSNQQTEIDSIVNDTKDEQMETPVASNDENIETLYGVQIGKKVLFPIRQSIQENEYYCGPAVVQMILNYFDYPLSQSALAKELHTVKITGTEYEDMKHVLNQTIFHKEPLNENDEGYHLQRLDMNNYSQQAQDIFHRRMRKNIDENYPSILALNLQKLYPQQAVANHFVLCVGYILEYESDEIAFYYIMDPYYGVQDKNYGGLKVFTPDEVMEAIVENEEPAYIW